MNFYGDASGARCVAGIRIRNLYSSPTIPSMSGGSAEKSDTSVSYSRSIMKKLSVIIVSVIYSHEA